MPISAQTKLFSIGILFHLVYIFSVFDIYFQSPIQHGLSVTETLPAEAQRLVLIVGTQLMIKVLIIKVMD
jgi:GPI ethanolamine phosphate transferase 1